MKGARPDAVVCGVASAPLTFVWLVVLLVTTRIQRSAGRRGSRRIQHSHSTNLRRLDTEPSRVLAASLFWLDERKWWPYMPVFVGWLPRLNGGCIGGVGFWLVSRRMSLRPTWVKVICSSRSGTGRRRGGWSITELGHLTAFVVGLAAIPLAPGRDSMAYPSSVLRGTGGLV
jgi:hypothetical protein